MKFVFATLSRLQKCRKHVASVTSPSDCFETVVLSLSSTIMMIAILRHSHHERTSPASKKVKMRYAYMQWPIQKHNIQWQLHSQHSVKRWIGHCMYSVFKCWCPCENALLNTLTQVANIENVLPLSHVSIKRKFDDDIPRHHTNPDGILTLQSANHTDVKLLPMPQPHVGSHDCNIKTRQRRSKIQEQLLQHLSTPSAASSSTEPSKTWTSAIDNTH